MVSICSPCLCVLLGGWLRSLCCFTRSILCPCPLTLPVSLHKRSWQCCKWSNLWRAFCQTLAFSPWTFGNDLENKHRSGHKLWPFSCCRGKTMPKLARLSVNMLFPHLNALQCCSYHAVVFRLVPQNITMTNKKHITFKVPTYARLLAIVHSCRRRWWQNYSSQHRVAICSLASQRAWDVSFALWPYEMPSGGTHLNTHIYIYMYAYIYICMFEQDILAIPCPNSWFGWNTSRPQNICKREYWG